MNIKSLPLRPRIFNVGFAPRIDAWKLRRRMNLIASSQQLPKGPSALSRTKLMADTAMDKVTRYWSSLKFFPVSNITIFNHPPIKSVAEGALKPFQWRWSIVAAAFVLVAPVMTPPMLALLRYSAVSSKYEQIIVDRKGISVHVGGQVVTTIRRPGSSTAGLVIPSHITANDDVYKMYDTVEGAGSKFTYFGWPIRSMTRAGLCHIGAPIRGDCGGASGEVQHLIRGLHDGGYGGDGSISRKVAEFLDAPSFALQHRAADERAALVLDNVSFGYLPGGEPIVGIAVAARTYWGVTDPLELTLAQKATLVGLFKYPVSWDSGSGIAKKGRDARRNVLSRARDALIKTFGEGDPRVGRALRELRMPGFLPTRPIAPLIKFDGATLGMIADELTRLGQYPGDVTDIELTVSSLASLREYQSGVIEALEEMDDSGQFARPLLSGGDERADAFAIRTAANGAVTGIVATTGRVGVSVPSRVGSHGKWVTLASMAKSGRFSADTALCNHASNGVQNAGGDTGSTVCSGRSMIPISKVFANSMNLPLIHENQGHNTELLAAAHAVGFKLQPGERDPLRSLVLGSTSEADPRTIIALGSALTRFANGGEAVGSFPFVLNRVKINGIWIVPDRQQLDLRTYFRGDQARALVAKVCPAPLNVGTLSALKSVRDSVGVPCAKSATVAGDKVEGYPTISKAMIIADMAGTWYSFVRAPHGYLGGSKISITPLSRAALE